MKVGVAGLEPKRFGRARRALEGVADLVLLEATRDHLEVPPNVEAVVVCLVGGRHYMTWCAKAGLPPGRVRFARGGVSSVVRAVKEVTR
jgi:hypothetical protein